MSSLTVAKVYYRQAVNGAKLNLREPRPEPGSSARTALDGSPPGNPSGQQVRPGLVIGQRYVLLSPIEEGAWGTVWRAEHTLLHKPVAIKTLRPDPAAGSLEWAAKRMLREARAVSQINHPAVVDVVDFGRIGSRPFMVMEFLEGRSLHAKLREGPMPWKLVEPLLVQAIEGLAAVHAQGITHRDIKPGNLFLTADDKVLKVINFGIASRNARLTQFAQTGELLGTPHFMSPEQTRGIAPEAEGDIYSLACVAYAMLVGRPPYVGDVAEIIRQHLQAPVPNIGADAPSPVPARAQAVLHRCLAKNPADRFSSMDALHRALTGGAVKARDAGRHATPTGPTWRRFATLLTGAGLVAAAGSGIRAFSETKPASVPDPASAIPQPSATGDANPAGPSGPAGGLPVEVAVPRVSTPPSAGRARPGRPRPSMEKVPEAQPEPQAAPDPAPTPTPLVPDLRPLEASHTAAPRPVGDLRDPFSAPRPDRP